MLFKDLFGRLLLSLSPRGVLLGPVLLLTGDCVLCLLPGPGYCIDSGRAFFSMTLAGLIVARKGGLPLTLASPLGVPVRGVGVVNSVADPRFILAGPGGEEIF